MHNNQQQQSMENDKILNSSFKLVKTQNEEERRGETEQRGKFHFIYSI